MGSHKPIEGPYQYPPDGGMDVYGHPTNPYGRCEYMNRNDGTGLEPPDPLIQRTFLENMAITRPELFIAVMEQWNVEPSPDANVNVDAIMTKIWP